MNEILASYNLWDQAWIDLESTDGQLTRHSIESALLTASDHRAIHDSSPLVAAGVHRLLTAILQDCLNPRSVGEVARIARSECFDAARVKAFGDEFRHRFDLFSADEPFFQSADLPPQAGRSSQRTTVMRLVPESPSGTEITHFRHGFQDNQVLCPICAGRALTAIPAFAAAGGAGIKPSINGVPPIYLLPAGQSLLQSLAASLLAPSFQPPTPASGVDLAWWRRTPVIKHKADVHEVGYLHSLTFAARRIRLHPEPIPQDCARCGERHEFAVRTMVFQMGESRPKDAAFWFDPFASYRLPKDPQHKNPTPIRPQAGKALWREYANLFLVSAGQGSSSTRRASVLEQLPLLELTGDLEIFPFRCIGLRTDMKAKIFEWIDSSFAIPQQLLDDPLKAEAIFNALRFATECQHIISDEFKKAFFGKRSEARRNLNTQIRMTQDFWQDLEIKFRDYVISAAISQDPEDKQWGTTVVDHSLAAFRAAALRVGDDADTLRQSVEGESRCRARLFGKRKEYTPDEQ